MEFPDKTAAPQSPPKRVSGPVITGAKKANRPATRRVFDYLMAESPKALARRVASDVVVPRVKQGLEEALNSFISGMFWGDGAQRPLNRGGVTTILPGGGVNYHSVGNPSPQALAAQVSGRSSGNYQDLVVPKMDQAETLLAGLIDTLGRYSVVQVADLYELAGITPATSDNSFGWYSLDGARIIPERGAYRLALPRPKPL